MEAYRYNHRIDFLEIDPYHLKEGISFAKKTNTTLFVS